MRNVSMRMLAAATGVICALGMVQRTRLWGVAQEV